MSPRKIIKKVVPRQLFQKIEPYGHLAESIVFNCLNGFPAHGMKVIGVTGTNGKTTTSFLIQRMLSESGRKTGLMTTVAYGIDADIHLQTQHMTNVPVPELMKRLSWMKAQGVEWLVLETTSHALAQNRIWGVPYSIAVLTNITHEHLDYHKTFENYVVAKQRLFSLAQKNTNGLQMGIANADDRNGASFAAVTKNSVLYGIDAGELKATNIKVSSNGIAYTAKAAGDEYHIVSALPGSFDVYNTLAAVAVGRSIGLTKTEIEEGIAALLGVDGRMERIDTGQDFSVIVDYAHTPDALENVLEALKGATKGSLAIVFGATGDRDKSKRPLMGEVAAKLANKIYLTDDETYTEDPVVIRQAVLDGIVSKGGNDKTVLIDDRLDAIRLAFQEAKTGDTILLAGMGHQDYRVMAGVKMPWDERDVARTVLKELQA